MTFLAKDFNGSSVTILSESVAHTALGATGQAQYMEILDGVGKQNLAQVDTDGAFIVQIKKSANTTKTNVSASVTSVTLQAANSARRKVTVYNDSTSAMYINCGATASTTAFVIKLAAGAFYDFGPEYTGSLTGIWDTATGAARVCEYIA